MRILLYGGARALTPVSGIDSTSSAGRTAKVARAALAFCVGVGVFFRFHDLDHLPGITGDEACVTTQS